MHPERRIAPRYVVALEARVDGEPGVTVSLSEQGVLLETPAAFRPQQEVTIILPIAYAAPPGTRIACTARIMRVERGVRGYLVAARFDAIRFETAPATKGQGIRDSG